MNKARRKDLMCIRAELDAIRGRLEEVKDQEQDAVENIPENLWGTDRYNAMEEAVENLDLALCSLEDALSYIESAED